MTFLPSRWVITPANNTDDQDVFPSLAGQGFLIQKSPLWASKVDVSVSGIERRRALWSYPVWTFHLGYEYLRADSNQELQRMMAFFNMKAGSAQGFFFNDTTDNAVSNMSFGTGDGTTTQFQITRTTTIGGITFTEPVRGFNGTPTIYVAGTPTSVTFNPFGKVTFATAPANGAALTWTGNFYFLCRFEKDELTGMNQMMGTFWDLKQLAFRTFRS